MTIVGNFIGGQTTFSASNETIPVFDPATGKVIRELTQSSADEVAQAIDVAHAAFPAWSKPPRCAAHASCSILKL